MTNQSTSTFERFRHILVQDFSIPAEQIEPSVRMDSLPLDSLDVIELMFRAEDEFSVDFPRDQGTWSTQLHTVGDFAAYIDSLAAQRGANNSCGVAAA